MLTLALELDGVEWPSWRLGWMGPGRSGGETAPGVLPSVDRVTHPVASYLIENSWLQMAVEILTTTICMSLRNF
jgi:hypothetical protein